MSKNVWIELQAFFTYLEGYDEEIGELSQLHSEEGVVSEDFIEQREQIENAVADDSPSNLESRMEHKIETVFPQTEFEITNLNIETSGKESKVTVFVELPNLSPSFTPDKTLVFNLKQRFDKYRLYTRDIS